MAAITRHLTKCFVTGVVALLPIAGIVLTVVYAELTISQSWLARQAWYIPGLGIVIVAATTYLIGLFLSNVIGKWIWRRSDRILDQLPVLGSLYQTLKQILGYGEGESALFMYVALIPAANGTGDELGLVTREIVAADGAARLVVFVPSAPTPTSGRLIVIERSSAKRLSMSVNEAMKTLVAVGKTEDFNVTDVVRESREIPPPSRL